MSIAEFSIKNRLICWIVVVISMVGGLNAYQNMPRFEDPEFTIRTAQVITFYPGATPEEVANEISETLEDAIQDMKEVDEITSDSTSGRSIISVDIKFEDSPNKDDLDLIFTKLRNKVNDAAAELPPGASQPFVDDEYGDVFGLYYLLTGDGFTPREMSDYADDLRKELLAVEGVGKVEITGELDEAIYVEFSQEQIANVGISVDSIFAQLTEHSSVVPAGEVELANKRIDVQLPETIDTVAALENTVVSAGDQGNIVRLRDVASVTRGYEDPPTLIMRYNGLPALGIGVSVISSENIVRIGGLISDRLDELESERPIGLEISSYYHQGEVVDESVKSFASNVFAALVIVLVTLAIFMGIQSGLVIGAVLVLTIAATLTVMSVVGLPLHRISLGALIIALGMLVDNAIVVTEGILIGVRAGKSKLSVAVDIVSRTKWPLLGGTIVGIIAFAPVGFAPGDTAEFTGDLFWVVMIALLFSWVFALSAVPFFADLLFKEPEGDIEPPKESIFMRLYKKFMVGVLRVRLLAVLIAFGAFGVAMYGLQFVKPGFFPASTTPQLVLDYWLPQGGSIEQTDADMRELETYLAGLDGVTDVHTLVGGGTLRYMLVYGPEDTTPSYGQFLVRLEDYRLVDGLLPQIQAYVDANFPDSQAKAWRFQLGPGGGSKIEAEFSGPDPLVLRQLAEEAKAVMNAHPDSILVKDDWRQQVPTVEPVFNEARARRLGITREDIADALNVNFSGKDVGLYREDDNLIPIVQRAPANERRGVGSIDTIQVASQTTGGAIPMEQLVDSFRTVWKDGQFTRLDNVWTIQAQADARSGVLPGILEAEIRPDIEAIELPPGYELNWNGESGDSAEANENLVSTLPLAFGAMVLTVVLLFNALRQPILIFMTIPLSMIGVVIGLLLFDSPLEFMAILGVLSLAGLLVKNAIVLVDQMDLEIREGKPRFDALVDSAASRVRPVMMGSMTTVFGVIPLLADAFFRSMAVVLMFGLSFATILTLVVVPALYGIFFRIKSTETAEA
ncbi:MAG: efflux RND transporter permease subunit [Pseudomonadota bacterium]